MTSCYKHTLAWMSQSSKGIIEENAKSIKMILLKEIDAWTYIIVVPAYLLVGSHGEWILSLWNWGQGVQLRLECLEIFLSLWRVSSKGSSRLSWLVRYDHHYITVLDWLLQLWESLLDDSEHCWDPYYLQFLGLKSKFSLSTLPLLSFLIASTQQALI